jgi:hypothetical protein
MRVLLFLGALLLASPAWAINDSIIGYCFTTANPKGCIASFVADERAYQLQLQQQALAAQLEQARIQANGMALFGAGNAMINGMNQGFQNMQQPYYPPLRPN